MTKTTPITIHFSVFKFATPTYTHLMLFRKSLQNWLIFSTIFKMQKCSSSKLVWIFVSKINVQFRLFLPWIFKELKKKCWSKIFFWVSKISSKISSKWNVHFFKTIGCNKPNVHFLFSLATPQKKPFNIIKDKNKSYFFFRCLTEESKGSELVTWDLGHLRRSNVWSLPKTLLSFLVFFLSWEQLTLPSNFWGSCAVLVTAAAVPRLSHLLPGPPASPTDSNLLL